MKFIVFVVLNIISGSLFVLFYKQKSKVAFYYAGYITAFSLGLIAITLDPYPELYLNPFAFPHLLARICSVLSYRMSPYFLLNAAFSVAGIFDHDHQKKNILSLLTLIPVVIGFGVDAFNPGQSFVYYYPDYLPNFWWLISSWSVLYVLLSNILLCYASAVEKTPKIKRQKMIIAFMTLPSLLITWVAYVEPILGKHDFTNITGIFGAFIFLTILIAIGRTGFIGLKLNFEHDFMDQSIRVFNSGASLINHAIRNELQLINIATENLKKENSQEAMKNIWIIENASRHLEDLARRFSEKTKPIVLFIEEIDLNQLVKEIVDSMEKIFTIRNIDITQYYQEKSLIIHCDRVHIREVLINIIYNSIEAMPQGGSINLSVSIKRHFVHLEVCDSGSGISQCDKKHILEPFYSTKKGAGNLGLGLTYCFAVMKQHHGFLKILSEEHKGATVILGLPEN